LLIVANKMTDVQQISDQIAILDGGRIIACGPPGEAARCDNPVVRQFVSQEDF
jgi:ABC-type transporter Mla maintaining outer membrane lipid asymmetry ATPase subunit MlaF